MKFIVRLVFALLGLLAATQIASHRSALPFSFLSSSTWARWSVAIVVGALLGWSVGVLLGGRVMAALERLERQAQARPAGELVVGGAGLLIGLGAAALAAFAVGSLPIVGRYLLLPLALVLGYLGVVIGARSHRQILRVFGFSEGGERRIRPRGATTTGSMTEASASKTGPNAMLVDTSAIIDGRIGDIVATGFLDRELIVPVFVLTELQQVADSADPQRRSRGRRGLDVVHALRRSSHPVSTPDIDVEGLDEVDSKLVKIAHERGVPILTTDYNLNKVARIQGVTVLNVNELANALKPAGVPGEGLTVTVIREGKELDQGVGYLDDGTMVVVEGGRGRIGDVVDTEVTSVLQSPSGKMIFTRLAS